LAYMKVVGPASLLERYRKYQVRESVVVAEEL
jgi:hypothetical protein